ncbi:MAG: acetyl-CoA carboxylase biotin carboxyl carrier protein [Acidobacteriota bacterium]|jgi:acetyl-CoA carboxylase biotin carboxyl carrier protein
MTQNQEKKIDKPMKLSEIQKLIEMLDKSGLNELELEMGEGRLRLSKGSPNSHGVQNAGQAPQIFFTAPQMPTMPVPGAYPSQQPAAAPVAAPAQAAPSPSASSEGGTEDKAQNANYMEIKSPMVGTFYRSPAPGSEPFVKVGDRVKKGQTLCIIEAMKLMNEIEAEVDGTVVEFVAENAQPVEFGEVILMIEPAA